MTWALRCAVVAVVLLAGATSSTVQPEPAHAYYDAITTAADWETVNGWLNNSEQPQLDSVRNRGSSAKAWFKARRAIGRIPSWAAAGSGVGTFTLAAGSALYLGWEIGHASGASDWAYGKVVGWGETAQPEPLSGSIRAYYWKVAFASGSVYNAGTLTGSPTFSSTDAWVPIVRYSTNGGSSWSERNGYVSGCVTFNASPCNDGTYTISAAGGCYLNSVNGAIFASLEQAGWGGTGGQHTRTYFQNGDTNCDIVYGEGTAEAMDRYAPTEQRPYSSATDAYRKTHTASTGVAKPNPTPLYPSGIGVSQAEAAIENDDALADEIGRILHPTTGGGSADEPALLPQPRLNETYGQYAQRLRAAGYLGTITRVAEVDPDVMVMFGPNVVTRVETATDTMILTDPWPVPPPTLTVPGASTEVIVTANPGTEPFPEPGEPGSGADPPPGNAPPPGGDSPINVADCQCPPPDFTPITDIDYGEVFPFGVLLVVDEWLDDLSGTANAPSWTFDDFEHIGVDEDYVLDLSAFDTYAGMIRTILSWAMWVGALWWFGARWLGFQGTGDPGEAVDEAWS